MARSSVEPERIEPMMNTGAVSSLTSGGIGASSGAGCDRRFLGCGAWVRAGFSS